MHIDYNFLLHGCAMCEAMPAISVPVWDKTAFQSVSTSRQGRKTAFRFDDFEFGTPLSSSSTRSSQPQHISQINFAVYGCFEISFSATEFSIHDTMIKVNSPLMKSTKQKEVSFEALAGNLQFLDFVVSFRNGKGDIVEAISLKLHAVCQGPQRHDHLLKEMKARIIYNLEISQIVQT